MCSESTATGGQFANWRSTMSCHQTSRSGAMGAPSPNRSTTMTCSIVGAPATASSAWCWVTGHSYIVYGPLANGATGVLYEGAPDTPTWDRWWQIIEQYKVSILYCAPTAIRAFMKQGETWPAAHDLSSTRRLDR